MNAFEKLNGGIGAVVHAELERYIAKEILEKVADTLAEKETVLYSDIQKVKSKLSVVDTTVYA